MTKQDIIDDLKTLYKDGKKPSKKHYDKFGQFCSTTVKNKFGSWSVAMQEVFGIQPRLALPESPCNNCGKITKNPRFCSSSCNATFNNKAGKSGRKCTKNYKCKMCDSPIKCRQTKCSDCLSKIKTNTGEFMHESKITKTQMTTNDTQRYRRIRDHARKTAKKNGVLKQCLICGYNTHVECAHVKPIKSFGDTALLIQINNPTNLIGLCPNHHWEFDNRKARKREILQLLQLHA